MEEDEIDEWYEDEKQKALDEYLGKLESNKNLQEAETAFNAKMDNILKKYNQLMTDKISGKDKNKKFKNMFRKIAIWLNFLNRK